MAEPVLKALDVWKSYDGRSDVLRGVSLAVDAGDAVLVYGPNGSGKTTLLSILGGLDVPTRGSVVLGGREIARLKESELSRVRLREVGFVFQTHNLIDDLTVEENVALPLRLARKPSDPRVPELLDAFDLARLATRRPKEISVGEAQRVAVARALANGPEILLADEPTAALDANGTAAVVEAFDLARPSFGAALVVATHDPDVAGIAPTRYRLDDGALTRVPGAKALSRLKKCDAGRRHGRRARSNAAVRGTRAGCYPRERRPRHRPSKDAALSQRVLHHAHLRNRPGTRLLLLDRALESIPEGGHRGGDRVVRDAQLSRRPWAARPRHWTRALPSRGRGQRSPREHRVDRHRTALPRSERRLSRRRHSALAAGAFVRPAGSSVRPHDHRLHGHVGRGTDLGPGLDRGASGGSADMAEHDFRSPENPIRIRHRLGPLRPRRRFPLPDAGVERERLSCRFRPPTAGPPPVRAAAPAPNPGAPTHAAVLSGKLRRGRDRRGGDVPPAPADLRRAREQRGPNERRVLLRRFDRGRTPVHHPRRGVHLVLRRGVPRRHGSSRCGAESHPPQRRSPPSRNRRDACVVGNDAAVIRGRRPLVHTGGDHAPPHPDVRLDPRVPEQHPADAGPDPEAHAPAHRGGRDHLRNHARPRVRPPPESGLWDQLASLCDRPGPGRCDPVPVLRRPRVVRGDPDGTHPCATSGVSDGDRRGLGPDRLSFGVPMDDPPRVPRGSNRRGDVRRDPRRLVPVDRPRPPHPAHLHPHVPLRPPAVERRDPRGPRRRGEPRLALPRLLPRGAPAPIRRAPGHEPAEHPPAAPPPERTPARVPRAP